MRIPYEIKTVTENDLYYLRLIHKRLKDLYTDVMDDMDNLEPYGLVDETDWLQNFIDEHKKAR